MSLYDRLLIERLREHRDALFSIIDEARAEISSWEEGGTLDYEALLSVRAILDDLPWWAKDDARGRLYTDDNRPLSVK